jgi:hypothetical protein
MRKAVIPGYVLALSREDRYGGTIHRMVNAMP